MVSETVKKLQEMRLSVMANTYMDQVEHLDEYINMPFDERFALIVDHEHDVRGNNKIKNLVRKADFSESSACLADILYLPDRHISREYIRLWSSNAYIDKKKNIILIAATGGGKSYIANALGVNACHAGYKVRYLRLPDFFSMYDAAVIKHTDLELMKQFHRLPLLILDEFLLTAVSESHRQALFELLERRYGQASTIFCSQIKPGGWHEQLGGGALADSILDRILPGSYTMEIQGNISMRQYMADRSKD